MCAERSSYGRAQGRSRAAFDRDGAIAGLLFAVAFSKPGCDSFSVGVCAVVMAPLREGRPGTGAGGSIRHPGAGRVICHGRPGRMSPGLVMARTGGNPGSPRCLTYEPGFIPGRDQTESAMKNSQLAGSQDDRAGTGWVRRWWTGDKLSVRLSEVAFVLVLAGAMAWVEWFGSPVQAATWSTVVVSIAVAGAVASRARRSRMSRSR